MSASVTPNASPRRRRVPRQERDAAILDAAFAAFAVEGFAAVRLDELAARLGIAKGTIYLYYPSKEALFGAAVRRRMAGPLQGLESAAAAAASGQDAMTALLGLVKLFHEGMRQPGPSEVMRLLVAEGHRF